MNRSQTRCDQKRKKHHWLYSFCHRSRRMRWCLCDRSRCLEDVSDCILSGQNKRRKSFTWRCTAKSSAPQWWPFSPNASADTSDFWGTWGRTRRGRGWAVMSALVGRGRSTRASVGAGPARCTRCSSSVWWCRRGYGQTPDSRSCVVQLECRQSCPGNPGGAQSQNQTRQTFAATCSRILCCDCAHFLCPRFKAGHVTKRATLGSEVITTSFYWTH